MTIHVSIKDAKNRLPAIIREAEGGRRVVITRNGKPVVDLTPHRRKGGLDFEALRRWKQERGLPKLVVGPLPPDFDDPLPEDFLSTPITFPDEIEKP